MADIKPIGSERLDGTDKIKRIMEIARYKEILPESTNDLSSLEYKINFRDGNQYGIIKERQGYIIKKIVSESTSEYIEPIKNRKYFNSYSQALKKLNLMVKENNHVVGSDDEISLFGEQKKFVLKTPKPEMQEPQSEVPDLPPMPPAEIPDETSTSPAPAPEDASMDMSAEPEVDMPSDEGGVPEEDGEPQPEMPDMGGMETDADGGEVTFKTIQKLTGKLSQKLRQFTGDNELSSENIKYVVNMILSALDLNNLSPEDKEEIMGKFESEEDLGGDDMGGEDITDDTEVEDIQKTMDVENDAEMVDVGAEKVETYEGFHTEDDQEPNLLDHLFSESKVDKILSNYFELTESEIKHVIKKRQTRKKLYKENLGKIKTELEKLSETIEQQLSAEKFLEENPKYVFVGKTNKKNLVFENFNKQIKITPEGLLK